MSSERPHSPLDRMLGVFTEVKPGEGPRALLLTLNIFLILTAYYIIKPVREALILEVPNGAEYKSYASGAVAVILLFAVPAYAALANRLRRERLITVVTAFFVACMFAFYVASFSDGLRAGIGIPFYLWVGVFNMMIVAQFWAFANDVYSPEQGTRLFALVGLGASTGAALGPFIASSLLRPPGWLPVPPMSVYGLLIVSAALLAVTAFITAMIGRSLSHREGATSNQNEKPKGAFGLIFEERYLTWIAAFALIFTLVNSNGEYILSRIASDAAPAPGTTIDGLDRGAWLGVFYGEFYGRVNILGVLLQSFVVSRLIRYRGFKFSFFVLPTLAIVGMTAVAILPSLLIIQVSKTFENATDYSLNNTLRNMLWLPTTEEMKYKAKQAVDTFFVRMGDLTSAGLVALGTTFGMGIRGFAIVNLVLIAAWILVASKIATSFRAHEQTRA